MLDQKAPSYLNSRIRGYVGVWYHFRGPNNKDYSILGSMLGSPYFGKLPCNYRVYRT